MPTKTSEQIVFGTRVRIPADAKHSLKDCMVKPDPKDISKLREESLLKNVELRKQRDQRLAAAAEKKRLATTREKDITAGTAADAAEAEGHTILPGERLTGS